MKQTIFIFLCIAVGVTLFSLTQLFVGSDYRSLGFAAIFSNPVAMIHSSQDRLRFVPSDTILLQPAVIRNCDELFSLCEMYSDETQQQLTFAPIVAGDIGSRATKFGAAFVDIENHLAGYEVFEADSKTPIHDFFIIDTSLSAEASLLQTIWMDLPQYSLEFYGYVPEKQLVVFDSDAELESSKRVFVFSATRPNLLIKNK